MSDFYRDDPVNEGKKAKAKSPYARPANAPKTGAEDESQVAYSAWRKPSASAQPQGEYIAPSSGAPRFGTDVTAGVPFSDDGNPTRTDPPVQMVNRRKSVGKSDSIRFAPINSLSFETGEYKAVKVGDQETLEPVTAPVVRHRRSSRYQQDGSAQEQPVQAEATPAAEPIEKPRRSFVEHSEPIALDETIRSAATVAPRRQPLQPRPRPAMAEEEPAQQVEPSQRRAVPGGRYQGARTAMPASGAPARRSEVGQTPIEDRPRAARPRPVARQDETGEEATPYQRPPRPMRRPEELSEEASSYQRAQRPAQADARHPRPKPALPEEEIMDEEEYAQARRPASRRQLPARESSAYEDEPSERAQARRPKYGFENEEEQPKKRKGGCLMAIIIVLLVVGALLAAILLPSWSDSGVGKIVKPMKDSIVNILDDVKNLVAPEEDPVKSFTVSPTETTAPADLTFNVQSASANTVKGVRVKDELGEIVASATVESAAGSVIQNKDSQIWTLRYTITEAYDGSFTLETLKKDGATWIAPEKQLPVTVSVTLPVEVAPPVTAFRCTPAGGVVPADLTFTVETSTDVNAVSIVNIYGAEIASAYLDDPESTATATITENGDQRVWVIPYTLIDAYAGSFTLEYRSRDMGSFESSAQSVAVSYIAAQPTQALATQTPEPAATQAPATQAPATEAPATEAPTQAPVSTPEPIITLAPTPSPTPAPVTPAPLPASDQLSSSGVDEKADPAGELAINANVYNGGTSVNSFTRTTPINMLTPDDYAIWEGGVFTFRSGPFRQNAAFGAADIASNDMEILWKNELGSMKTKSKTVYGMGFGMQPAIVKWYKEARSLMNITDAKKDQTGLREVIAAGYDGKIYFYDLTDGTATREAISLPAPAGGSVSVATNGTPIMSVGQSFSYLSGKTVKNEYRLYSLIDQKELTSIEGTFKNAYATNTAFSNTSLFDKRTGAMIVGGENGLLYTLETGEDFNYISGKLTLSPATQSYRSLSKGQKKTDTSVTTSVAMYDNLAYFANTTGVLQCVDVNSLTPVWAVAMSDTVEATPALDYDEEENAVALYTGRLVSKLGKKGTTAITRIDAITGAIAWQTDIEGVTYNKSYDVGCKASPVVGQNNISDLVIYNVANGKLGSIITALDKKTGNVVWSTTLTAYSYSSPVAVYNEDGDAWLIVGDSAGVLNMLDARTGESVKTLTLEGAIEGSPAVYRDILVVGTTAKAGSYLYGIKLK